MKALITALYREEAGFLVSGELALISTIGVLGMAAGLAELSSSVDAEMQDVGQAVRQLDQSFTYSIRGQQASFRQPASQASPDFIQASTN